MHISAGPGVRSAKANRTGIINTITYKEICGTSCKCIAHHSGEAEMEGQPRPGVSSDAATKTISINTSKHNEIDEPAYRRHTSSIHPSGGAKWTCLVNVSVAVNPIEQV